MSKNRIAGITSNTLPWEILRAAGYTPVLLEDEAGPTPHADRWMEDVFDRRFRVIFDRLCAGAWNHLDRVVIPRTSEQEHKLYLYLREIARTRPAGAIPELYFYNLLHTRTPESYDYGLERTRQMIRDFDASEDELRAAIAESNRARVCVRDILQKPRGATGGISRARMDPWFLFGRPWRLCRSRTGPAQRIAGPGCCSSSAHLNQRSAVKRCFAASAGRRSRRLCGRGG